MKANKLIPQMWILISLLFTIHLMAQNNIVGYEYAFNNGSPPTYVPIAPTPNLNLVTDIDVSTLTNDVNVFYIRFKDENGLWSSITSKIFVKPTESTTNASNIVGYEYGFNDLENVEYVAISPTSDFNLVSDFDVSALSNDVNVFYVRFKDDIGQWSSFISKIFVKPPDTFANASTIVGYEYGFNDGNPPAYVSISPSADFNLAVDIDVSALPNDINEFYVRFKDDIGKWSSIISKIFVKPPDTFASASTIVGYEYGFNDYENPVYVPIAPTADFNLAADIDVIDLTKNVNVLRIRFKDDLGQWSSMVSKIFVKPPDALSFPNNSIVSYEYWFDNDDTEKVSVNIDTPVQDYILTEIDVSQLWAGEYRLNTQFKDTYGHYSVVMTDTINKSVLPLAQFSTDAVEICSGEAISFLNTSVDYDNQLWDFDDGNTSNLVDVSHTFNTPGSYEVSLFIEDTVSGLSDTTTLTIEVSETPSDNVTVENSTITAVQSGASYQWIDCTNGNNQINGETNQSFTPSVEGEYAVEITMNGCTIVSECVLMTNLSLGELDVSNAIKLYPNPVDNTLIIKSDLDISVEIYDLLGKRLNNMEYKAGERQLDMSNYAHGLYLIKVYKAKEYGRNYKIFRIIKR